MSRGFFAINDTMHYCNGVTSVGFVCRGNLQTLKKAVADGPFLGDFGALLSSAMIPSGYFIWNNTRYYSIGNGHFFGFLSQISYDAHRQQHVTDPTFGFWNPPLERSCTRIHRWL